MLPVLIVLSTESGCKKSSSVTTQPPTTCTADTCLLTGYKWEITSQVVGTNLGEFKYSISQVSQLNWATFLFKKDSTYTTDAGGHGTYQFTDATNQMILYDNLLPLNFNVAFPTSSSLILSGDTIRIHPRTDQSISTTFAINSILPGLHDDFGVDTSRIQYFQTRFYYNGY